LSARWTVGYKFIATARVSQSYLDGRCTFIWKALDRSAGEIAAWTSVRLVQIPIVIRVSGQAMLSAGRIRHQTNAIGAVTNTIPDGLRAI
jgi:hypothetical protein